MFKKLSYLLTAALSIAAAACAPDMAHAQIINPNPPQVAASAVAGTGLSQAGAVISVNYGTTAGTAMQGNTSAVPAWHTTNAITASTNIAPLGMGTLTYSDTNIFASWQTAANSYSQAILQNSSNGATASTGWLVSNDLGTATTFYGEFGMNSSGFTGSGSLNLSSATYLTATSGDLAIGTTTANGIHFVVNNGATDAMAISSGGAVTAASSVTATGALGGASLNVGTGQITAGYLSSVTGAVNRGMYAKLGDFANARDFGAKCDGSTDDTSAINTALTNAHYVNLPAGTCIISGTLFVKGAFNATTGRYEGSGIVGQGMGVTFIKAASSFTSSQMIYVGNSTYNTTPVYAIENTLANFTVDNTNQTNDTSHSAIYLNGTYNNKLENLQIGVLQNPYSRWDLNLARGTYTTSIIGVNGGQLQVSSDTLDRVTTINFVGGSWTFININNANSINFNLPTIQGTVEVGYQANRVQISSSYNVSFIGGDLEGDGTQFNVTSSQGIYCLNNNIALAGSYTFSGTKFSVFWNVTGSTNVVSRDNIFMNWTTGPGSPTPGTYYVNGGGNSRMNLYDFFGGYLLEASYGLAASQSYTTATPTIINFPTVNFDTASAVTTGATWKFTAPIGGTYTVNANVFTNIASGSAAYIAIYKNGVEFQRSFAPSTVTGNQTLSIESDVQCAVGDTIAAYIFNQIASPSIQAAATANYITVKMIPGS